ncbi:MAG: hypothetical protein ACI4ES_12190 [Roseburia sp.]
MSKARVKSCIIYRIATFDGQAECYIDCYPQQRFEYRVNGDRVTLDRKGISLVIPKEDFDKHWKVVE